MSLPRQLSFLKDKAGLALVQGPVTAPLRGKATPLSASSSGNSPAIPYEAELQFAKPAATVFGVRLYSDNDHWTEIAFDMNRSEFYIDRTKSGAVLSKEFPARTTAPLAPSRPYNLRFIVDRSSVEAFAQNGTIAMTDLIFPPSANSRMEVFPPDTKGVNVTGVIWELKSIWKQASSGK
jgi:sucrose-6-phosphate hydrolase SacC (GH32 family)